MYAKHAFVLLSRILRHDQNILFGDQVLDDILNLLSQVLHLLHVLGLPFDLSVCQGKVLDDSVDKIRLLDTLELTFALHILHPTGDLYSESLVLVVGDTHFSGAGRLFLLCNDWLCLLLSFFISLHVLTKKCRVIRFTYKKIVVTDCPHIGVDLVLLLFLLLLNSELSALLVDLFLVVFKLEVSLDQVDVGGTKKSTDFTHITGPDGLFGMEFGHSF